MNDQIDIELEARFTRLGSAMERDADGDVPYAAAVPVPVPGPYRRRSRRALLAAAAIALVVGGGVAYADAVADGEPDPVAVGQEDDTSEPATTAEQPAPPDAAPGREVVVPDDGGLPADFVPADPTPAADDVAGIVGGERVEFNVMAEDPSTWNSRYVAPGATALEAQAVFRTGAALSEDDLAGREPAEVYLPGGWTEEVEVAGADAAYLRLNHDRVDLAVVVGDRSFVLTVGHQFGLAQDEVLAAAAAIAGSGAIA